MVAAATHAVGAPDWANLERLAVQPRDVAAQITARTVVLAAVAALVRAQLVVEVEARALTENPHGSGIALAVPSVTVSEFPQLLTTRGVNAELGLAAARARMEALRAEQQPPG